MPLENTLVEVNCHGSSSKSSELSLHRAALSLFSDLSLEGVLRRIVRVSRELVCARSSALYIHDEITDRDRFLTEGISKETIESILLSPNDQSLKVTMAGTSRGVRLGGDGAIASAGISSFLAVPIRAYGKTLGQIYLADKNDDSRIFSEDDQSLIEMFSAHAAAAIENARLYKQVLMNESELTQRNEELELIHSLTSAVSSSMELEDLLEVMFERVLSLFSAGAAEIFLRFGSRIQKW